MAASPVRRLLPLAGLLLALPVSPARTALPPAAPPAYLRDARTARGVEWTVPRSGLAAALKPLAEAAGLSLDTTPQLAHVDLVGHVPRRTVRETMTALEQLFDARWETSAGGYRLVPDAARWQEIGRRRDAAVAAAIAALKVTEADRLPPAPALGRYRAGELDGVMGRLLFAELTPAQKKAVLEGRQVTISVAEKNAAAIYQQILLVAEKKDEPRTGPIMATCDLGMNQETRVPYLRVRATTLRAGSIVGAISILDWVDLEKQKPPAPAQSLQQLLPQRLSTPLRLNGNLDEQALEVARLAGLPLLSRHAPPAPDRGDSIAAAGRTVGAVVQELVDNAGARLDRGARGFLLLRSLSEHVDEIGEPDPAVVERYLKARPGERQPAPLETLAILAELPPLQLSRLWALNLCTADARAAIDLQALLRFYTALSPDQRKQLYSAGGLPVESISHPVLHALLDARVYRGDWDVHPQLQRLKELKFRWKRGEYEGTPGIQLEAISPGREGSAAIVVLPVVMPEQAVKAAG